MDAPESTSSEAALICPHCGYDHCHMWEVSTHSGDWTCQGCGIVFEYQIEFSATYYGYPVKEEGK